MSGAKAIFYEVATLEGDFADPSFALVRIDTSKRVGSGVEGVIVSLYWTRPEADAAANLARMPVSTPLQPEGE